MDRNKNITVEKIFKLALENHQENNIEVAKSLYNEVLEIDPDHSRVLNNLGVIFAGMNDYINAIACYEKAIKIDLNYADTHYNLGIIFKKLKEYQKAIGCFEKTIEIDPNHLNAYNNLGAVYKDLSKYQKAKILFKKTIEINSNYVSGHCNLGLIFYGYGDIKNAIACYEKAIKINPNLKEVHNNLGLAFQEQGKQQKSISCYEKAIEIYPNYIDSHYNLGILLYEMGQYKDAIEHLKIINSKKSNSHLLGCLYKLDDQSTFFRELDRLLEQGEINALIGSLCSRSEIRYGVKRTNPFCKDPLKYVLNTDLTKICDFKNTFIKTVENVLNDDLISNKKQTLLTNGIQTAGNLFSQNNDLIKEMKDTIIGEVNKYQTHFKDSNEGLIKSWPNSYNIKAWLISMKSGGILRPHMHEQGWLSGSVYINVPPKIKVDSGNLVICIDDTENNDKNPKKIIDVMTGSLCLFPASLHHYTIPFDSEENRVVLAFDVIPD
jgi:tetratricopeptide (TPR) repeat protein